MKFPIDEISRQYLKERYPRATEAEREKYVRDWSVKIEKSQGILKDFELRIGSVGGKKILDCGSGIGGTAIVFADSGADVTGVEVERELHDIAIKQGEFSKSKAKFILYDGNVLPLNDHSFDSAISVSVLEHTSDPKLYINEILRVLKPGGKLYLAFPNRLWPKETHTGLWLVTYLPLFLIDRVVRLFGRNPLEDNNLHFYTYWSLLKFIKPIIGQKHYFKIIKEGGRSKNLLKLSIRKILRLFGLSYKAFLPHVSVVLEKV